MIFKRERAGRRGSATFLTAVCFLSGCVVHPQTDVSMTREVLGRVFLPAKLVKVPFDASRKGAVATLEYFAPREHSYTVHLNLNYDEGQPQSRGRIDDIAGMGTPRAGQVRHSPLHVPVRLRISKLEDGLYATYFDKVIKQERLQSWGSGSFSWVIAGVHLVRGTYKVEALALEDTPALYGIPMDLDVHIPGK